MAERRPIASRNSHWAGWSARRLAEKGVTPNRISQASMGFGALAGLFFWGSGHAPDILAIILLLLGALACQARLICNLLDGMVAIEGGLSAPDGPFWNEAPDRVADLLILAGVGAGLGHPALGMAAGAGAVLTAYVRELGRAEGIGADFSGPMAKPQRMAAITAGAVLAAVEVAVAGSQWCLFLALLIVLVGSFGTAVRRSARLIEALKARV